MERKCITFQNTQQIVRFVNLVSQLDFDVDVKYGSRIVDGKSIVGVLSLASCKTVDVIFHSTADSHSQMEELLELAS